jgi:YggT family protein
MVLLPAASLLLSEQQTLVPSSAEVPLRLRSSRVAAPADPARVKVQVRTPEKMAHVAPARVSGDSLHAAVKPEAVAAALVATAPAAAHAASAVWWVGPTKVALGSVLTIGTVLFLFRVVLSWFPKYDLTVLPWSLVAKPTEPVLGVTRKVIPPVAGVDISPLVWVGILSFISEVVTGPQGLLSIIEKKGI